MDRARSVVILKLRPYSLHAGTIGIARSLGRLGVDIHVIGDQASSPVARSRYVRSVRALPVSQSADQLADSLRRLAPAGCPLLLPVDDLAAVFVQNQATALLNVYRFPCLPDGLVDKLVDKAALSTLAHSAGVPSPTHATPVNLQDVDAFLAATAFPVVVKMRDPKLFERTHGVSGVEIAQDAAKARDLWIRHVVDGQPNCIFQEYVPGGPQSVWMVNAYIDKDSIVRFAATGRKLRQFPPYTGATSLGICEGNDEVLKLTARLVHHIGYRGILDIGWRYDARDGSYKLLDFNPRIGATFRLFVGRQGLDVLRACYSDMSDHPILADEVQEGRKWVNESYDVFSAATYWRDGVLSTSSYLRSYRNVAEATWLARDDPAPALSMFRSVLRLALPKVMGRLRARFRAARKHEVLSTDSR